MDPAKLKSLVDQQSAPPDIGPLVGMAPASPDEEDDMGDDDDDDAPVDPLTRGNELLGSWGEQGEALKEAAGEFVDSAHEIGGNLILDNPPEEAEEAVEDKYESLPEDIQVALAQQVAPLAASDITALATALVEGNDGEEAQPDVKLVGAYVKALAEHAAENVDPDDFVTPDEDEDGDEDGDGDGDGDGDAAAPAAPAAPPAGVTSTAPVAAPGKPLA